MNRIVIALAISVIMSVIAIVDNAYAAGLQIAPLEYADVTLQKAEVKKGFVDVSNPTAESVSIAMDVQAFRQIDNQGGLEFYRNEAVAAGVQLDLQTLQLGPREAMRVYFLLDGSKLPTGDVFAAIMARIVPAPSSGSIQTVQVGTLLLIQNDTPSPHQAVVTSVRAPWFQWGEGITAQVAVKNTAETGQATGFSPRITMALSPYRTTIIASPLIFAGRTRQVEFREIGNYFGPLLLSGRHESSQATQLIFAVTGYWRWLAPLVGVVGVATWLLYRRGRWRLSRRLSRAKSSHWRS